ncbi:MAG: hypothetical protein EHM61_08325 [Acidobacteria bacterium]|nr:MAG: hypothetical protein EHM61_08325 [Acidobacteriota bacterium]
MNLSSKKFGSLCLVVFVLLAIGVPTFAGKPARVDHKALQNTPIQLGTSGGSVIELANGYCCSGTLGALVRDPHNGALFVLSNTHVFAGDSVAGGNQKVAKDGDDINHPGFVDTSCGANTNIIVADLSDWCPIVPGGVTLVDAAIAQIRPGMVSPDGAILEIGTLSSVTLAAFPGLGVKKSGRTSGLTRSTVESLNATISVGYSTECAGSSYTSTYRGQILVKNRRFLNAGDSGSLMVEDVPTNPRAVGLLYAGSNTIAVANPISAVLAYFDVEMVGAAGAAGTETPAGEGLSRAELARAIRVQQLNEGLLLGTPGAIGHAVGAGNGRAVIKVLVEELSPEAVLGAPREIEGIQVVVEPIGKIMAY